MIRLNSEEGVEGLVSPYGLISQIAPIAVPLALDRVSVFGATIGSGDPGNRFRDEPIVGTGRAIDDPAKARAIAISEAAERYASEHLSRSGMIVDTADNLQGSAIDTRRLPSCSAQEYAQPHCPFVPFDPAAEIHWTKCVDLVTGRDLWIPAVMAAYGSHPRLPGENFWYQISTGSAAHPDPAEALVQGIIEIIERDAVALTWLQKLSLPEIEIAALCSESAESQRISYLQKWGSDHFLSIRLFDATTDLGIPTIYCVTTAAWDAQYRNVVAAATSRTLARAAEKAMLEAIFIRPALARNAENSEADGDFKSILDGPRYMASPERNHAFDFLLSRRSNESAAAEPPASETLPDDPRSALECLLHRLASKRMQVLAVDLTCSELADVGLTAVNVVIPDLQPMCLHRTVQFRGHARLYDAPRAMGYQSLPEKDLNQWPQPFG